MLCTVVRTYSFVDRFAAGLDNTFYEQPATCRTDAPADTQRGHWADASLGDGEILQQIAKTKSRSALFYGARLVPVKQLLLALLRAR